MDYLNTHEFLAIKRGQKRKQIAAKRNETKTIKRKEYRQRPNIKIKRNIFKLLNRLLKTKNPKESLKISKYIGCTPTQLRKHIENQFNEGMSWENYGKNGWEIDHIVPCANFNFLCEEEIKKCFNFNNLRPIKPTENNKKHTRNNAKP